jgi:hypothetical protein
MSDQRWLAEQFETTVPICAAWPIGSSARRWTQTTPCRNPGCGSRLPTPSPSRTCAPGSPRWWPGPVSTCFAHPGCGARCPSRAPRLRSPRGLRIAMQSPRYSSQIRWDWHSWSSWNGSPLRSGWRSCYTISSISRSKKSRRSWGAQQRPPVSCALVREASSSPAR